MHADRILLIDDEAPLCEMLQVLFEREGFAVRTARSGEEGLDLYDAWQPDVVLTDLNMPGIDGIELLRLIRARAASEGRDVPVVLFTAYGSVSTAVAAMREGAFDYVTKPFHNDELRLIVRKALAMRALEADNARLRAELGERYQLGQFVGNSPRILEVYGLVRRIMGTRINCLITGESGTGKELVARAIHYGSERSSKPFVALNCGAIPENLFESELFGYARGAFTGANRDKIGMLEAADGGTLLLDEVGEMPLSAQVKVLRALAERKVTPLGSTQEITVDVRIIAATNRDLRVEVAAGRFREDLYYRLNVVQIDMPPLRERPEDLAQLAQHFVDQFAKEYDKPAKGVSPEAMRLLSLYGFPGNVRELQNIIERAVALEAGPLVTPASLPEHMHVAYLPPVPDVDAATVFPEGGLDLDERLAAIEKRYLERALEAAEGNRTKAARLLRISFRSIRYRLVKLGLEKDE